MKIYFCDSCNESIPLTDLKNGRAATIKDKVYCTQCNPLGSIPDARERRRTNPLLWALLVVAAAAAGYAVFVAHRTAGQLDDLVALRNQQAKLQEQTAQASGRLAELRDSQERITGDLAALREQQAVLRQLLADQGLHVDRNESGLSEMRNLLEALRTDRETLQKLEIGRSELEKSLAELRAQVQATDQRVASLSGFPAAREGVAEAPPPEAEEEAPLGAEARRLVASLSSKDPSERWSAADRLFNMRDSSLVPYLIPLLGDSDAFVQFRVISGLRELNARSAVGDLIQLLRDGDALVREEALEALVALTGNPARFDVTNGTPAEREKGVRLWEEWYAGNRERFTNEAVDAGS